MPNFVSRILQFALRVVLWGVAAVFTLSLLAAGLILISFSLLKSLISGKKPKPMVFGSFQRFSSGNFSPASDPRAAPREAEVVDVEVREIREEKHLP